MHRQLTSWSEVISLLCKFWSLTKTKGLLIGRIHHQFFLIEYSPLRHCLRFHITTTSLSTKKYHFIVTLHPECRNYSGTHEKTSSHHTKNTKLKMLEKVQRHHWIFIVIAYYLVPRSSKWNHLFTVIQSQIKNNKKKRLIVRKVIANLIQCVYRNRLRIIQPKNELPDLSKIDSAKFQTNPQAQNEQTESELFDIILENLSEK